MMDRLTDAERLAVAQAFYNACGKIVSTKDPDSLRSVVDNGYKELYDATGSRSFDVKLLGEKVGTYSLRFSKETQPETVMEFRVYDEEALADAVESADPQTIMGFIRSNLGRFAEYCFNDTGEILDGCSYEPVQIDGKPSEYIGGVFKVDTDRVADVLRGELPPTFAALLEAGER